MSADDERVRIEIEDGVAVARMVRGDKHNGLDWPMFLGLDDAVTRLNEAEGVRAVVLCGEGRSFCAGLDWAAFAPDGEAAQIADVFQRRDGDEANLAQRVVYGWLRMPVPVVAALQGVCYGGGCQLALGADIRIAAPDTRMSVMEIKYGLVPDMAITKTLPSLVRADVAKELVLSGRVVEAEEALALGLVTRLADDPFAAAHELAREIASKSPDAVRADKRLLNRVYQPPVTDSLAMEASLQGELIGSPNQMEAVDAAMNKRQGEFSDPEPAGLSGAGAGR